MLKNIQFTGTELPSIKISSVGYSDFKTMVLAVTIMQKHLVLKYVHEYIFFHLGFFAFVRLE